MDETPDETRDPLAAGMAAAFGRPPGDAGEGGDAGEPEPPNSVLACLEQKTGAAPRVSLSEDTAPAPLIDPNSEERHATPRGRGNYQLMGEIARGGMGVVLKGHDADLGRDVALKVLHKKLAGHPEILRRFVEEAQIGGQLQHPGIVPVYELGLMADERPYFTMKLVKGRTLATLLAERKSGSATRRSLLNVFESMCQTMAYAHSRGVIHRDLKPANVMVGAFGEVQVVDWGLAKVLARGGVADEKKARDARSIDTVLETVRSSDKEGSGSSHSLVGSVMGTPAYMSPEQAQGQVDRLDERSDVFSLGAILCEILTGQPPYSSDDPADKTLTNAGLGRTDPALERLAACDADGELVELTRECLLIARDARPAHAGIVAERVQAYLAAVEERAHAAAIDAAVQRRGRKLTLALAATILVAALGVGGTWLVFQGQELARQRDLAQRDREIEADVSAALIEASLLQGQERFGEAFAAVQRAESLSQTSHDDGDMRTRIAAAREELEAAAETARRHAESLQRNAQFLAQLDAVEALDTEDFMLPEVVEAGYVEAFVGLGQDVDQAPAAQVADGLRARGLGHELIPYLDRWLVLRSRSDPDADTSGLTDNPLIRLIDLLHAFDGDPLRADLREAMLNRDVGMLRELAANDLEEYAPSTLYLLSSALSFAGDPETSARVVRAATRIYPSDFFLQRRAVNSYTTPEAQLARLRIVQALRPDDLMALQGISDNLRTLGARARWRGDDAQARAFNRESVEELVRRIELNPSANVKLEHAWLVEVLLELGDLEAAREAALAAAEGLADELPDDPTAMDLTIHKPVFIGVMLRNAGLLEEAEHAFGRVADRPVVIPQIHERAVFHRTLTRALRRAKEGDVDGALAVLHEALEANPRFDRHGIALHIGLWTRADLYVMVGATTRSEKQRVDPALDALSQEARQVLQGHEQGLRPLMLAIERYLAEDWEAVLSLFESVASPSPDEITQWNLLLALAHHELGNLEEARALYETAVMDFPGGVTDETEFLWLSYETEAPELCARARAALEGS